MITISKDNIIPFKPKQANVHTECWKELQELSHDRGVLNTILKLFKSYHDQLIELGYDEAIKIRSRFRRLSGNASGYTEIRIKKDLCVRIIFKMRNNQAYYLAAFKKNNADKREEQLLYNKAIEKATQRFSGMVK